jgi:MerR family mercuric resistance operon transcriptional regulator
MNKHVLAAALGLDKAVSAMNAITDARATAVSIGELSRRTGVNSETIRYYEKVKLLPADDAFTGLSRQESLPSSAARELGFTPDEVRALLDLGGPGKASCAEVRTIAAQHLEEVRAKIADLRKLEQLLAKTIAKCSGRKVPDCPVIDILET